jgi:DNA-binding CsgD family transcriptional regulator
MSGSRLTPREIRLLHLYANGGRARDVMAQLQADKAELKVLQQSVQRKLGAVNMRNAVAIAVRNHIIRPSNVRLIGGRWS